jgi:hypothetical protein
VSIGVNDKHTSGNKLLDVYAKQTVQISGTCLLPMERNRDLVILYFLLANAFSIEAFSLLRQASALPHMLFISDNFAATFSLQ